MLMDEINRFEKYVRRRRFGIGDPERQAAGRYVESVSELLQSAN